MENDKLTLRVAPGAKRVIDEIARIRGVSPAQAISHALVDYRFLLEAEDRGDRVLLERRRKVKIFGFQITLPGLFNTLQQVHVP